LGLHSRDSLRKKICADRVFIEESAAQNACPSDNPLYWSGYFYRDDAPARSTLPRRPAVWDVDTLRAVCIRSFHLRYEHSRATCLRAGDSSHNNSLLGIQVWYVRPFVRVVAGRATALDFCREFVAFFDDYRKLEEILPKDAALYVPDFRAPAVYSPRPMVFDSRDIPRNRTVVSRLKSRTFLLASSRTGRYISNPRPGVRRSELLGERLASDHCM